MDFQNFIDCVESVSCVLSVEKLPDGSCGNIRIVCGNQAYIDSLTPVKLGLIIDPVKYKVTLDAPVIDPVIRMIRG